ncbi:MAG: hypothetical protein LC118_05905 [Dehalococcoidia bacterium]|nr:hypothetical protein [Opitutaceae bacterium]MCZ2109091.1 hypothetical protein [Dehalococcoidia bacterium]
MHFLNLYRSLQLLLFASLAPCLQAAVASPLSGSWRIDPTQSTDLSPWKEYDLTILIAGKSATVERRFANGRRVFEDKAAFPTTGKLVTLPFNYWPDNRHLGAAVSGGKKKRVSAHWVDDGRILRVTSDFVLSTQQGDRALNVLSDYKVSINGEELTLTELRSTRDRPIVYVFKRVASSQTNQSAP